MDTVCKKHDEYLKLAFPKTLRKVKSGSTRGLLPSYLDMVKEKDLSIPDVRVRSGGRDSNVREDYGIEGLQIQSGISDRQVTELDKILMFLEGKRTSSRSDCIIDRGLRNTSRFMFLRTEFQ